MLHLLLQFCPLLLAQHPEYFSYIYSQTVYAFLYRRKDFLIIFIWLTNLRFVYLKVSFLSIAYVFHSFRLFQWLPFITQKQIYHSLGYICFVFSFLLLHLLSQKCGGNGRQFYFAFCWHRTVFPHHQYYCTSHIARRNNWIHNSRRTVNTFYRH